MRLTIRSLITAITIASGLIVLLGYFFDIQLLNTLRQVALHWGVILAAVALWVGVANLALVHWQKVSHQQSGWFYSLTLLISLALTLIVAGIFGPTSTAGQWIFNYIQVPIETSLMALLPVVLAYAAIRLARRRLNLFTLVFLATAMVALVGMASLPGSGALMLGDFRTWLVNVWSMGGARGILIGVALGATATGLRVLLGADRPYGGGR